MPSSSAVYHHFTIFNEDLSELLLDPAFTQTPAASSAMTSHAVQERLTIEQATDMERTHSPESQPDYSFLGVKSDGSPNCGPDPEHTAEFRKMPKHDANFGAKRSYRSLCAKTPAQADHRALPESYCDGASGPRRAPERLTKLSSCNLEKNPHVWKLTNTTLVAYSAMRGPRGNNDEDLFKWLEPYTGPWGKPVSEESFLDPLDSYAQTWSYEGVE